MAVTGALEGGLTGNHSTLFAKSMLDGISAIVFSSTMGVGVVFSALPVFVYQGTISLMAKWAAGFLSQAVVAEITAVGGLLIVGIGLNILEVAQIRVGNLVPAILFAALLTLGGIRVGALPG